MVRKLEFKKQKNWKVNKNIKMLGKTKNKSWGKHKILEKTKTMFC